MQRQNTPEKFDSLQFQHSKHNLNNSTQQRNGNNQNISFASTQENSYIITAPAKKGLKRSGMFNVSSYDLLKQALDENGNKLPDPSKISKIKKTKIAAKGPSGGVGSSQQLFGIKKPKDLR